MTIHSAKWTRRQFAQTLAASAAASLLPSNTFASPIAGTNGFVFIGSTRDVIHVFHVSNSRWTHQQARGAISPVQLTLHPTLPVLYAVHNVALWDNLPRGAVTAYSIASTGHLTLLRTQPLSLAATNPRLATIAPDGTSIAVAAPETGIFNILPLSPNGILQPPAIIRKDLTLNIAKIQSISFLADSKTLLTTDSRHRALHAFTLEGDFLVPTTIEPGLVLPIGSPTGFAFRPL